MNIILNDIEKDDEIYNKIEIDCSPDNLKAIIKFSMMMMKMKIMKLLNSKY